MNTSPNKRKRRRKTENFENPEMAQSSSVNQDNADCTGNKWKRRLHSLRRSLSKKKVTNLKKFQAHEEQDEISLEHKNKEPVIADITFDNRCKENIVLNGWQQNCNERQSPLLNDYSSSNSPNLDSSVSSDDKANKRKGFHRRAKGDTMWGNKYHHSTSQQNLQSGKNKSLNGLDKQDTATDAKRSKGRCLNGRKNKRLSLFSSWFKLPSRASSEKNLKRRATRLSVSTGNFNEQSNFKLLTDVKLLRDPGYVSSSGDSLDLDEERYQSLRRSRASLIDIKWHKHARSEGNLVSPVSRNHSLSPLSSGSSKRKEIPRSYENSPNFQRDGVNASRQTRNIVCMPDEKCKPNARKTSEGWHQVSQETSLQCGNSLGSFGNITEDDDVYLTAEEDSSRSSPNLYLDTSDKPMPDCSKETELKQPIPQKIENLKNSENSYVPATSTHEKNISSARLPISDINGNAQQLAHAKEPADGVTTPNSNSLHKSQILHVQAPIKHFEKKTFENVKNNIAAKPMTYVCKSCQLQANGRKTIKPKDFCKLSLGQLTDFNERPVVPIRCMQCKSPRISKQSDTCHDVLITRPPKKPAPKPPALMKNKSKSLTALAGKFPGLSEQLDLNETSSLHKLNDSCSDNLCELLSQSKDASSPTSEGVYVGIMGDQGVILRKRRVYSKQKRVVSMPSELLENVMEVEGAEGQSSTSKMRNGKTHPLESSESEVYLSCNSNAPSIYNSNAGVLNSTVEKELCSRSVSISSIDVQDVSSKKKIHSQSVPCLAFNKDCLDGLKSTQTNQAELEENLFPSQTLSVTNDCSSQQSSTAQSMMSLNFPQSQEGSDETSDKVTGKPLMYAEALWDHVTMNEEELCFTAGQAIAVYDVDDPEWWFGLADDHIGWFPASFVRIPVSGDLLNKYHNSYGRKLKNSDGNSESGSDVCLSKEEIRAKIVDEIVSTERDYVQNLKDIVEGYLKQAKKRPDMFNDKLLAMIFSNIEKIYHFHLDFLRCIERQYNQAWTDISSSGEVGAVFVQNKEKFELYAEYCNNHPRASSELKQLLQQDKYRYFFEACRMLQDMIKISLDGFLLTPVQKICKYPLQLQELLKYTNSQHSDYKNVENALEAMREVASSINEKKRKVENIKKIAEWQLGIEQWEGEDVLIKSSQLVHSGEVVKLSKGKAQDVTLFLFDHQLVYCRKDLIKKRSLEYKGRIVLENYKFEKLEDGEVSQNGMVVINAWRLSSKQSNTSCIFQAKSSEQRDKWIGYFLHERKIVYETTSANSIPLEERLAAMDEAKNSVKSRKQIIKGEKRYGNFNTVSRAIGQLHYGSETHRRKIDLPPPVSSAMLFERDQVRSSFLRSSGVFKKRRAKPRNRSQPK